MGLHLARGVILEQSGSAVEPGDVQMGMSGKEIEMGWGRTLLLGDIGNRLDIADTERDIASLRTRLRSKAQTDQTQDKRLGELERENDQLKLYLASLIRLLVSKGTLSHDELAAFVDIIDTDEAR